MSIYYFTPYSLEKNIGKAYNDYMKLLPKLDDWAVIMDGDIMFLNFNWGHIIAQAIEDNPNAGIISCLTNRISKRKDQLYEELSTDILVHRIIAKELAAKKKRQYRKIQGNVSGFLMAIKKRTWKDVGGFPEKDNVILDVDGLFSRRVRYSGRSIVIMKGLYVLHYYRMAEGPYYKDHLRDAQEYHRLHPPRVRKSALQRKNEKKLRTINARKKKRRNRSLKNDD